MNEKIIESLNNGNTHFDESGLTEAMRAAMAAGKLRFSASPQPVDVFGLIKLTNCHPRVNIHSPGVGVGGHRIPVVPWFIHEKFEDETPLILEARLINNARPKWVADRVGDIVSPPATVAVLGMTYKNDTGDLRDSVSVEFAGILKQRGYNVICCEPNALGDVFGYENLPLEQALERADFAVITLAHKQFVQAKESIGAVAHYDCVGLLS